MNLLGWIKERLFILILDCGKIWPPVWKIRSPPPHQKILDHRLKCFSFIFEIKIYLPYVSKSVPMICIRNKIKNETNMFFKTPKFFKTNSSVNKESHFWNCFAAGRNCFENNIGRYISEFFLKTVLYVNVKRQIMNNTKLLF